jgi:hypothetical protein
MSKVFDTIVIVEKCVKCNSSIEYLADYEDVSFEKLLVEATHADLKASQLNA